MEKSLKTPGNRERLLPVALIVVGLVCASWLTIRGDERVGSQKLAAQDTVIKKNQKTSGYHKRHVATEEINEEPVDHIVEVYHEDDVWIPQEIPIMEEIPWIEGIEAIEPIAPIPAIEPIPDIYINIPDFPQFGAQFNFDGLDTIPGNFRSADLARFSEEFEKAFRERYQDFYQKNGKELDQMMKEIQERVAAEHGDNIWAGPSKDMIKAEAALAQAAHNRDFASQDMHYAQRALEVAQTQLAAHEQGMQRVNKDLEEIQRKSELDMRQMESKMKAIEKQMHEFEEGLKEQLVKDGYLSKGEALKNMSWEDDGTIEINGKKIKDADKAKYQKLHEKYFKGPGRFHYVE